MPPPGPALTRGKKNPGGTEPPGPEPTSKRCNQYARTWKKNDGHRHRRCLWSRSAELIEQHRRAGSTADPAEHTSGRGVSVVGESVAGTRELVDRKPVIDGVRDHEHAARLGAADREQLLLQLLLGDRIEGSLARLAVGLGGLPKQPLKTRVAERLPLRIPSHRHRLAMGAKRKGE